MLGEARSAPPPFVRLLLIAGTTVSLAQLRSRFQAPQPPIDWRVQPLSG